MNSFNTINIDNLLSELVFKTTRSSGKGGQNVNKVSTKVILIFDIVKSQTIDDGSKELIMNRLINKISNAGLLQMSSSKERSQFMNKKAVIQKFLVTINKALETDEERIATKPGRKAKAKRLDNKSKHSEKKQNRKLNINEIE